MNSIQSINSYPLSFESNIILSLCKNNLKTSCPTFLSTTYFLTQLYPIIWNTTQYILCKNYQRLLSHLFKQEILSYSIIFLSHLKNNATLLIINPPPEYMQKLLQRFLSHLFKHNILSYSFISKITQYILCKNYLKGWCPTFLTTTSYFLTQSFPYSFEKITLSI